MKYVEKSQGVKWVSGWLCAQKSRLLEMWTDLRHGFRCMTCRLANNVKYHETKSLPLCSYLFTLSVFTQWRVLTQSMEQFSEAASVGEVQASGGEVQQQVWRGLNGRQRTWISHWMCVCERESGVYNRMAAFCVVQSTVTAVQLQADSQADAGVAQQVQTLQVAVFSLRLTSCPHVSSDARQRFPHAAQTPSSSC